MVRDLGHRGLMRPPKSATMRLVETSGSASVQLPAGAVSERSTMRPWSSEEGAPMLRRTCVILLTVLLLLTLSSAAVAGPLEASQKQLRIAGPVGATTTVTFTVTNTSDKVLSVTYDDTYLRLIRPQVQDQVNVFAFGVYEGCFPAMAPGESCDIVVDFRPGVYDDPDPMPGTIFRARIVMGTSQGRLVVPITATVTSA
jgi:hypothetical protein